ncbi:MAG: hypothetical protein PWR10_319 [Halanaerobiales bacterium]|nr:hypothetical protein [Halanaerobiales bacterium]
MVNIFEKEIIQKMKEYFGEDKKRINHALQVTDYARTLIKNSWNQDLNPEVIIYAAILHDIGIKQAEEKYNSTAGRFQEIEGPPIARRILNSFPISEEIINEVCEIIAHHHSPGKIDTYNFKLLYDADWLVNLPAEYDLTANRDKINNIIDRLYLTEVGKELASKLFN